jgi:hypothetical protein
MRRYTLLAVSTINIIKLRLKIADSFSETTDFDQCRERSGMFF